MGDSATVEVAVRFIQVILVALVGGGTAGGGWLAWRAKRKADVAKVASSAADAEEQHKRDTIKELRLLSDYAHELRGQVMELGQRPLDWPDSIRHLT